RAAELAIANLELAFQNSEKDQLATDLGLANLELAFQNIEKEKKATELVLVNNDLQKAEEQFRLVVESAPYAMVLIDNKNEIVLINSQTEKLFEYKRVDLVGKNINGLIPERFLTQIDKTRNLFKKNLNSGKVSPSFE